MTTLALKMQHTSLQFSDSRDQQERDVEKLFSKGKLFPIKTGTEASNTNALHDLIQDAAKEYGHVVQFARGNFVAVDKRIIKPKSVRKGQIFVVSNDKLVGKMHDRVAATLAFTHVDARFGRINQAAIHYATRGARPGDPNYKANVLYAQKIEEWMRRVGRGSALAFANGDFNMNDEKLNWALGKANFTSMADELDDHQNTGHGPIDGFCSYDRDGRVKAKKFEVYTDREMLLHSDHFLCRGTWSVRALKVQS